MSAQRYAVNPQHIETVRASVIFGENPPDDKDPTP
jgi:hypothetical protein